MDKELRFIGTVRSEIRDRREMPSFGAPAGVELAADYEAGLVGLEKHSHYWVLAWLIDRGERDVLQVVPRGVDPGSENALHGVFAVRSPARPNPIGLTVAKLLERNGTELRFDLLDFVDGTPVLDIKPYFVSHDLVYSALNLPVGRPKSREQLREGLVIQALRFCPERHAEVALAVRLIEHYRVDVCEWVEPEKWTIEAPLHRSHLIDALMGMTRISPGRGLKIRTHEEVSICGTAKYELRVSKMSFEEVLDAAFEKLFQVTLQTP